MRSLLAILLVPALFAVFAPAAPVPKHLTKDKPVYYYPTTVGTKWEYSSGIVLVVSKVEERNGTKVVTIERVNGDQRSLNEVVEVSAVGLVRTECGAGKFDPPYTLLKTPVKAGDAWSTETTGTNAIAAIVACKGTHTVAGTEQIKVPAGTFEAVRVDVNYTLGGNPNTRYLSAWYAPNVGLVKMTEGGQDNWALKSFTPGEK